jgi:hypothetical protein
MFVFIPNMTISIANTASPIGKWFSPYVRPIPDTALNYIPTTAGQLILEDGSITITHGGKGMMEACTCNQGMYYVD